MRSEFLGSVLVGDVVRGWFRKFGTTEALLLCSEKCVQKMVKIGIL
nr:MAG TPA: hypothetical protein [Caudoviricetes sp.]